MAQNEVTQPSTSDHFPARTTAPHRRPTHPTTTTNAPLTVLGRLASKLAKIAFVFWKFQESQAFQVWGWLMVNACKETFFNA
jgi:hypothetical protein